MMPNEPFFSSSCGKNGCGEDSCVLSQQPFSRSRSIGFLFSAAAPANEALQLDGAISTPNLPTASATKANTAPSAITMPLVPAKLSLCARAGFCENRLGRKAWASGPKMSSLRWSCRCRVRILDPERGRSVLVPTVVGARMR